MGLKTFTLDPAATALTPDEVVAKVNAATADITRAESVAGAALVDGEVTAAKLAVDSVTNPKIAPNAVDTAELVNGAVTNPKIGALAVDTPQIAIDAIKGGRSRATGVLTLTGQPLNTETVTIGGKVYTFQTVLTNVDGNVLIGGSASASLDNLIAAINLDAGAGTTYAAATTEHPTVDAVAGPGDTMDVIAMKGGPTGNTIGTTETLTNGSFGGATLSGGAGSVMDETAAKSNLDSQSIKERLYTKSDPAVASGAFRVTALKRTPAGLLEIEYDGVAV